MMAWHDACSNDFTLSRYMHHYFTPCYSLILIQSSLVA